MKRRLLLQFAATLLLSGFSAVTLMNDMAHAHDVEQAGAIEISGGWARAMLPGQAAGGGYLTIVNSGADADRLLSVASTRAGKVEVHSMKMDNDVMIMRPVEGGLEIPAGATVELRPGGYHIMFMKVAEPFAEGDTVPLTLEFEKAGKITVDLPVGTAKGGSGNATHAG